VRYARTSSRPNSTQIPVCLWFLARDKRNHRFRDRRGEILFIDARKLGEMEDRTHRRLPDADIGRIADTYHRWRGEEDTIARVGEYEDVPGFCKSTSLEEIRAHSHVLTPGRYVGAEAAEEDTEPFEEKMRRLTEQLREQQAEARRLDAAIEANLETLGYAINE
jgi:type I restriction enzyme M protein